MSADSLVIFDFDGTITHEGYDSWMACSHAFIKDQLEFQKELKWWKENKKRSPFEVSSQTLARVLKLYKKNLTSQSVQAFVYSELEKNPHYLRKEALDKIKFYAKKNVEVVISTASFQEVGLALIDYLRDKNWVNSSSSLHCLGTQVDWQTQNLLYFNMGHNKLMSLLSHYQVSEEELKKRTLAAFGDSPEGNDKEILKLGYPNAFIVTTKKNSLIDVKNFGVRVTWAS